MRLRLLSLFLVSLFLSTTRSYAQTWDWATLITGESQVNAAATDGAGNTYVVGRFAGTIGFGPTSLVSASPYFFEADGFVAKLAPNGRWLWAKQITSRWSASENISAVTITSNGDALVSGNAYQNNGSVVTIVFDTFPLTVTNGQFFVARITASGQWMWANSAVAGSSGGTTAYDMAYDATTDRVAVAGAHNGSSMQFGNVQIPSTIRNGRQYQTEILVMELDATNGQWQWAASAGSDTLDYATSVAYDPRNHQVVVGGMFLGDTAHFGALTLTNSKLRQAPTTPTQVDVFVARLSATGTWLSVKSFTSPDYEFLSDLAVDHSGGILVVGSYHGPSAQFDALHVTTAARNEGFIARLSPANTWQWVTQFITSVDDDAAGMLTDIALDQNDNIVVGGDFGAPTAATATARCGPITMQSWGGYDLFVAKVNSQTGQWLEAASIGGTTQEELFGLHLLPDNSILLSARSRSPVINYGASTLVIPLAPTNYMSFTAKLTLVPAINPLSFTLAPNPAREATQLIGAPSGEVQLVDVLGQVVRSANIGATGSVTSFDLTGIRPGLYLVKCGKNTQRLFVE